jgi:hypothetical protein
MVSYKMTCIEWWMISFSIVGKIYLVPESTVKEKILRASHDTPLAGHPGYFKNCRKIREIFLWKGLKDDVLWHVRGCMTCHTHPIGLLHPLPIPEQKWESVLMEFITGLQKVQGRDYIFVMVDKLT